MVEKKRFARPIGANNRNSSYWSSDPLNCFQTFFCELEFRVPVVWLHYWKRALEAAGIGEPCHRGSKQPHRGPHHRGTAHLCDAAAGGSQESAKNQARSPPYACNGNGFCCGLWTGRRIGGGVEREGGRGPAQQRARPDKGLRRTRGGGGLCLARGRKETWRRGEVEVGGERKTRREGSRILR